MSDLAIPALVKRYFQIREIVRQKGLPEEVRESLWEALDHLVNTVTSATPEGYGDIAAKLRLASDLAGDWHVDMSVVFDLIARTLSDTHVLADLNQGPQAA